MGVGKEFRGMGDGLAGIGDGLSSIGEQVAGWFDRDQRAASAEIRDAQNQIRFEQQAARAEITAARAAKTADAIRANTAQVVHQINTGGIAGKVVEAQAKAWTFGRIASKPFRLVGEVVAIPLIASAKIGKGALDMTAGVLLKPVTWTAQNVGKAFSHSPWLSTAVVAGTAAVGAGTWLAKREGERLQVQSDAIAQMQAVSPQGMYMNNPEASQAFVDARMAADREHGVAGNSGSKVDAVMAARQQQPAPESANLAAL